MRVKTGGGERVNGKRKLLVVVAVIVVPVLLVALIGQVTPVFTALLLKPLIDRTGYAPPRNMEHITAEVAVVKDLAYSGNGRLDLYYPRVPSAPLPVVLWIHGGGYIGGRKEAVQAYGMALANEGYVVANIEYAVAPGQKYPGPVVQANAALQYLQVHVAEYGGDRDRLFIGGDSAGAQIASQVAVVITNADLAKSMSISPAAEAGQLKGVLLYCGAYDFTTVRAAHFPFMATFLWAYTGEKRFEVYPRIDELSTVKQVTAAYPPAFLTVGDADPLAGQTAELIAALKQKGVEVDSVLFGGTGLKLDHEYQFKLDTAPAQQAFTEAVAFLNRHS